MAWVTTMPILPSCDITTGRRTSSTAPSWAGGQAERRDNREVLRSDSAEGLLERIRVDYAAHPVSRRIAGADRPETPGCRFRPEG